MKVDVSRHHEIFTKESRKAMGKDTPIVLSVIPIVTISVMLYIFIFAMLPWLLRVNWYDPRNYLGIIVFTVGTFLSIFLGIYLGYDVYGNYLFYKGIWKNPPFAKSSIKIFWKYVKMGKKPYLLLSEKKGNCTIFHIIQRGLFQRGVIIELCDDELNDIKKRWIDKLKEEKDRIEKLVFEYERYGIKGLRIVYRDGREMKVGKKDAEILGVLIYLGRIGYTYFANVGKIMGISEGNESDNDA